MASYWISEIAFWISGPVFACRMKKQNGFWLKTILLSGVFFLITGTIRLLPINELTGLGIIARGVKFLLLIFFLSTCWKMTWSTSIYYSIWGFISWQLVYELWLGIKVIGEDLFVRKYILEPFTLLLTFIIAFLLIGFTIAKWIQEDGKRSIGPRQLISALVIFSTFQIIIIRPRNGEINPGDGKVEILYLTQLLITLILYLQSELFKKSAMRQELSVINLLWEKAQQQYQLSQENIMLINQKCHDLKHQIRGIRNSSKEDIDGYLEEMEDSIYIYEAIVKTGNEVLDTILTEKSLYCKEHEITVSCVVDGNQMNFINTVDLYAILGNTIDNAIEAVEKFEEKEKRQIDIMIYRQQNFLIMNIINPIKGTLVYEEELPVTTKKDRKYHGYGLKSMKHLVKKYDGFLSISEENGCFSLKMLIPIPKTT